MDLEDSVRTLAGVGPKRQEALAARGIETVGDLLTFFPTKYIDRSVMGTLEEETESSVTVEAVVVKKGTLRRIRRNLSLFVLSVEEQGEDGGEVKGEVTFFNQPWLKDVFKADDTYYFHGRVVHKNGRRIDPRW